MKREASLQRFLRKLKQKNVFNEIEYDKLYPSGSAPTRLCGTPKMHEFSSSDSFHNLHPIVSSIGTFNYNLAHLLCNLLSPLVPNDYSFKDTRIKNANISKKLLVSYSVTSLFTNIPLQETVDIPIHLIFNVLKSISKMIRNYIFLNIYTPLQHSFTHIILFVFK